MGVPYGGLVIYSFKLTDLPVFTEVKNKSASCVLRLGFQELHKILDERPEGKMNDVWAQK
jgi:hypothetical protein